MNPVDVPFEGALDAVIAQLGADVARALAQKRSPVVLRHSAAEPAAPELLPTVEEREEGRSIAARLVLGALENGLKIEPRFVEEPLTGGNATQQVLRVTLSMSFAFKADGSRALLEQVDALERFRTDPALPPSFQGRFPRVFAVQRDGPPYAYIMEFFAPHDGWRPAADALYVTRDVRWQDLLPEILGVLREGHAADAFPGASGPSVEDAYLRRLEQRMVAARELDDEFRPRPLVVNGVRCRSWEACLECLREDRAADVLCAPFRCVVHGDAHLRNVLFRPDVGPAVAGGATPDTRLIDPKPDFEGDYLVDVAKVAQYLVGSGPIEDVTAPAGMLNVRLDAETGRRDAELRYEVGAAEWTGEAKGAVEDWARVFAAERDDHDWWPRFEVAMATTFLTLPKLRLERGARDVALALYGEGLLWLNRACASAAHAAAERASATA